MTAHQEVLNPQPPYVTAPDPDLRGIRVLLVHGWLYTWAGAERVLEQLLQLLPNADVLAGLVTPEMRGTNAIARAARESWVGALPFARSRHRWFLPAHALAFATYDASEYDLVISISHAFEKAVRARKPHAVHVSYCLSPPRYLWHLSGAHDALARPLERLALRSARLPLRALDRRAAKGVHRFVSISQHVADRVRTAYGRISSVVYPPVQMKSFTGTSHRRQPFLLSLGRLVPYKRVDLAIAAAERLGIRLVVAGDGPDRRRLERLAGQCTEFVGTVSEERAGELLSTCTAFVFCAQEDFGIAPLEANAHGAPVVAYAKGGAAETMRDGETAVMFGEQSMPSVVSAIERCLGRSWDEAALRANAQRFSPARFREGMHREISAALRGMRE